MTAAICSVVDLGWKLMSAEVYITSPVDLSKGLDNSPTQHVLIVHELRLQTCEAVALALGYLADMLH
jgi:hypothetical protein